MRQPELREQLRKARSADAVGMEFPGGKTLGDKAAITLRFDPTYMQLAADGKL